VSLHALQIILDLLTDSASLIAYLIRFSDQARSYSTAVDSESLRPGDRGRCVYSKMAHPSEAVNATFSFSERLITNAQDSPLRPKARRWQLRT